MYSYTEKSGFLYCSFDFPLQIVWQYLHGGGVPGIPVLGKTHPNKEHALPVMTPRSPKRLDLDVNTSENIIYFCLLSVKRCLFSTSFIFQEIWMKMLFAKSAWLSWSSIVIDIVIFHTKLLCNLNTVPLKVYTINKFYILFISIIIMHGDEWIKEFQYYGARKFWFLNLSYVAHTRRLYAKVWPRH